MSEIVGKKVLDSLKDYLVKHGYPDKSIISEYKLGKYRADLVVVDIETNMPIQLFEIKAFDKEKFVQQGEQQLKIFLNEARKLNADVIGYLVFPSNKPPFFEVKIFEKDEIKTQNVYFNYEDQINRSRFSKTEIIKTKKTEVVDEIKDKSIRLCLLMLVLLVLDILNVIEVTNVRFYLIISLSVMYLLPNYEEIKIFNFELKKNTDKCGFCKNKEVD